MIFDYAALPLRAVRSVARIRAVERSRRGRLTPDSPCLDVMTDFAIVPAASIAPEESIDEANRFMIRRGVRLLLVLDHGARLIGLITATDLLGERPVQVALERGVKRHEISVREIMTPSERIEVLPFESLGDAKVGHVVATLRGRGRQHGLVVETAGGEDVVRGVFSLSQIANDLGVAIEVPVLAETFAEIEAALGR